MFLRPSFGHVEHSRCPCLTTVVLNTSATRMTVRKRARWCTLGHLAVQAYGRGSWSPKSANQRQSRRLLGCSAQERRKRRAKISLYVSVPSPSRNANHLVTATAAPNSSYHPFLWTINSSEHTTTAYAMPVCLFTLAIDCSSLLWNIIQYLLCHILPPTTSRSSN